MEGKKNEIINPSDKAARYDLYYNLKKISKSGMFRAIIALMLGTILILFHIILGETVHDKTAHLFVDMLKEVGFALIVAALIWISFEYLSSYEREIEWEGRLNKMSNNVFRAVLLRNIPENLWDSINKAVFRQSFLRKNFEVTFTFYKCPSDVIAISSEALIMAEVVVSYDIHNMSETQAAFPVVFSMSGHHERVALRECKLNYVIIYDKGVPKELDISILKEDLKKNLQSDNKIIDTGEKIILAPKETASIRFSYSSPKDRKDTEVLVTSYPAEEMRLNIIDNTGLPLIFGANSIHPQELELIVFGHSSRVVRYELKHHLLPHQGIFLNWSALEKQDPPS